MEKMDSRGCRCDDNTDKSFNLTLYVDWEVFLCVCSVFFYVCLFFVGVLVLLTTTTWHAG